MKDPLKVDNPIATWIDGYKIQAIHFCKNNIRNENKDPKMYV